MDIDRLKEALPDIGEALVKLMLSDGFRVCDELGLTLDEVSPSVALTYSTKDGQPLSVRLSIEIPEADEDEENY